MINKLPIEDPLKFPAIAAMQVLEFLGFPFDLLDLLTCTMIFTRILQGNLGPRRSLELLGSPRKS